MSEENKNTPLGEDGNLNEIDNAPADSAKDLDDLDSLVDKFAEEYEKTKKDYEAASTDDNFETSENETNENAPEQSDHNYNYNEEIADEMLCVRCKSNPKDLSVSENNEYCEACRKVLIKYPYSVKNIVSSFFTTIFVLTAVFLTAILFVNSVKTTEAGKYEKEGKILEAAKIYEPIITSGEETGAISLRAASRFIEILYKMGNTNYIATYLEKIPAYALKLPIYSGLKEVSEKSTLFTETLNECSATIQTYSEMAPQEIPYDDAIAQFDQKIDSYTGNYANIYKGTIIYAKYYVAYLAEKEESLLTSLLEEIKTNMPDEAWLYAFPLASSYTKVGKQQEALALADELTKVNADDPRAYIIQALAYRMSKDYGKALDACDRGEEVAQGSTYELTRQKAIILLLQGNAQQATELLEEGYMNNMTLEVCDTLAICALASGNEELFNSIQAMYEQYQAAFGDNVLKFKAGELTAEQIFLEGKADVY